MEEFSYLYPPADSAVAVSPCLSSTISMDLGKSSLAALLHPISEGLQTAEEYISTTRTAK